MKKGSSAAGQQKKVKRNAVKTETVATGSERDEQDETGGAGGHGGGLRGRSDRGKRSHAGAVGFLKRQVREQPVCTKRPWKALLQRTEMRGKVRRFCFPWYFKAFPLRPRGDEKKKRMQQDKRRTRRSEAWCHAQGHAK